MKKTFNRLLPAIITQRRKKGFGIPLALWLKNELNPLLRTTLNQNRLEKDGIFNVSYVQKLMSEHEAGRRNNRKQLFSLLIFHLWKERFAPG